MTAFSEKQKMNGAWIAIIPTSFMVCLVTFQEMKPLEEDWKNILPLLTTILIMAALCVFMFKIELKTKFTDEYVQVLYSPFHWKPKYFYWKDVAHMETRTAECLKEYWGWGIKGTKKNRSYTAYGDFGLQLTFTNGNRLFIGSQKKEELESIVNSLQKSITPQS
jgi:hypothetical protein